MSQAFSTIKHSQDGPQFGAGKPKRWRPLWTKRDISDGGPAVSRAEETAKPKAEIGTASEHTREERSVSGPGKFKGWVMEHKKSVLKLNASYLIGTVMGAFSALGGAYAAKKLGLDDKQAATYVAGVCHFSGAMVGVCASWVIFQKDKYLKHPKQIFIDAGKIAANSFKAQAITWAFTWAATYGMIVAKVPWEIAVIMQTQVLDRIFYIPLFNYFNRKRVEETSEKV